MIHTPVLISRFPSSACRIISTAGSLVSVAQRSTSLWNQLLSVAAGLSVISLLHDGHVVPQPRLNRLVHRHLEGHLFEHLTHRHLEQTRGWWLDSLANTDHTSHIIKGLITSWKWSFLNMAMLTWLSRPIFTWNFLTPSLVTPSGSKHTDHKSLLHTGGFILKCLKDLWIIHTGSFLPGYSAFHKGLNFSTSNYVKAP